MLDVGGLQTAGELLTEATVRAAGMVVAAVVVVSVDAESKVRLLTLVASDGT